MKNIKRYRDLLLENFDSPEQQELDWDLIRAVRMDRRPLVKVLLERGANPNCMYDDDTPLSWAAQKREIGIMKDLLEAGADPNIEVMRWGRPVSVLCMAVDLAGRNIVYQMMKMLLDAGADPNRTDHNGRTPVSMIARASDGNWKKYELLFKHGADPNVPDSNGRVALDWPLVHMSGSDPEIVKMLIINGADPFRAKDGPEKILAFFDGDISWMPEGPAKLAMTRMQRSQDLFGED